jgi:type IV secretory pathway VirB4 component
MKKKKKLVFEYPYIDFEIEQDIPLLYGVKGNPIAVIKMENPVLESCSDIEEYQKAHNIFLQILKLLGDSMILQKIDIVSYKLFDTKGEKDVLEDKYLEHFKGRKFKSITTYLSITESFIGSSKIAKYNRSKLDDFINKINKVEQILKDNSCSPKLLDLSEMEDLMLRYSVFDFDYTKPVYGDNIMAEDTHLQIGDKYIKSLTLVDTEKMVVPNHISPVDIVGGKEGSNTAYPIDNMRVLFEAEDYEVLIYNQVIEVCAQTKTKAELELKKKRCVSVPDAINALSARDIEQLLEDIVENNQLIVRAHFNIIISCESITKMRKCANWFESVFFSKGLVMGRNSYNQMQLWRGGFFGNANEIDKNDMFLTTSDSSIAFFFQSENS